MEGDAFPLVIEIAKVAASPILAAITAIWMFKRQQREQVHCSVGWDMVQGGPEAEIPYIAVQNRSDRTIMIRAFDYRTGLFRKTVPRKVAIYWDDPFDLHFPMGVEAGQTRKFRLDHHEAKTLAEKSSAPVEWLHRISGRPRLTVQLQTMAGTSASASLEPLI